MEDRRPRIAQHRHHPPPRAGRGGRGSAGLVGLIAACLLLAALPAGGQTTYDTRHYRIVSDLDPALTLDLAARADAMYEEYARRLIDFAPPAESEAARFEIRLFDRRRDYLMLTGDRFSNSGGIFMPGRNILAAYLEEQGRDSLRRTLQHEAFHQFAYTNISPNLPSWLDEGLSQIFEEGIFVNGRFQLGEVAPRRVRQLQHDLREGRLSPFRTLMGMSKEQWHLNLRDQQAAATLYNQSWAMVHFLIFAPDPRDGRAFRYRPLLIDWLRRIHAGEDPNEAFTRSFSDNIEGFQERFLEFARRLDATPQARAVEHQTVLADLLIELHNRGRTFETAAKFRDEIVRGRYRIHYTKGSIQWSTAIDPSVYFADLRGRPYKADQLRFDRNRDAPLPDLVCAPDDSLPMRTRFYLTDGKVERETLVEPPARRR